MHDDVIPGAEAEERRRPVAQVGEDELSRRTVGQLDRLAGARVDQLRVDEAAGAEVHPVLGLAFAPQRDADVADPHRLGDLRSPAGLEAGPEGRLAAARLARHEHPLDARSAQVEPSSCGPLDDVGRVGRRQHGSLGAKAVDRGDEPLGVAGADRDVAQPDPVERGERGAGDEGPGVVGRDDPLAAPDARGGVAPGRAGDPVVEVAGGERDEARRAGRAGGRVDPDELLGPRAEVRADRVVRRDRLAQLLLPGERELRDLSEPARLGGAPRCRPCRASAR